CCPSPSEIICVKTRRCWSRKKSSGRRCSIAGFSAWLSSKIAPRTERSASRLFGKGFSSVASAGISVRFIFAYNNTKLFCRARLACKRKRGRQKISGGENNYDGLDQFLFAAL